MYMNYIFICNIFIYRFFPVYIITFNIQLLTVKIYLKVFGLLTKELLFTN